MKKETKQKIWGFIGTVALIGGYMLIEYLQNKNDPIVEPTPTAHVVETIESAEPAGDYFTICSWNPQVFGDSKAGDIDFMNFTADMLDDCDIAILLEIRDKDSSAFWELCDYMGDEYNCVVSSRAGYSTSKEQVGFFFRKYISLDEFIDLNSEDTIGYEGFRTQWSRPPPVVLFSIENTFGEENDVYSLYLIAPHLAPDYVPQETQNLEDYINSFTKFTEQNTMIIGDGNWDWNKWDRPAEEGEEKRKDNCQNYYDYDEEFHFVDWLWIPRDDEDTTAGDTYCAYDRAILNAAMIPELREYEVYKTGIIPGDVDEGGRSDHYLLKVYIEPRDQ